MSIDYDATRHSISQTIAKIDTDAVLYTLNANRKALIESIIISNVGQAAGTVIDFYDGPSATGIHTFSFVIPTANVGTFELSEDMLRGLQHATSIVVRSSAQPVDVFIGWRER